MRRSVWTGAGTVLLAILIEASCAMIAHAQQSNPDSLTQELPPPEPAAPETPPAAVQAPAAGGNLLNPNISAIGWFQAEVGDRTDDPGTSVFRLREVELGYQATVDPFSRADFFISVNPEEGIDVEEGYLTLLTLPAGLTAKLGKFRSNFGKFNRTHPPETPFADRPLAAERFLGEEGLAGIGASVSWLAPLPFYLNIDAEVTDTPDSTEVPSFQAYRGTDLTYLGRVSTFLNLGEPTNVTLGASYANGANGAGVPDIVTGESDALRAQLYGGDFTFRWKNPRRAIYRSFLAQAEWMERSAEQPIGSDEKGHGWFATVDYQFARRWHVGARYDDVQGFVEDATGGLGFLTFTPSEFALMSLQAKRVDPEAGDSEWTYFFKTTFNIGPHGQHPF